MSLNFPCGVMFLTKLSGLPSQEGDYEVECLMAQNSRAAFSMFIATVSD